MKIRQQPKKQRTTRRLLIWLVLILGGIVLLIGAGVVFMRVAPESITSLISRAVSLDRFRIVFAREAAQLGLTEASELPTIYIDMDLENYQRILEKRQFALDTGVLLASDEDMVPGMLQYEDEPAVDIELRLKGDWTDHLSGDKWSFRIHTEDGHYINGMRRFSIQDPRTREFLNQWLFNETARAEGLLAPRYTFVNVFLRGEALGIYALEEHFSKELLESQGRRAGVIVRFDETAVWQHRATYDLANVDWAEIEPVGFLYAGELVESAEITPFSAGSIAADPTLTLEAQAAMGALRAYQRGERTLAETFDVEKVARYLALSDVWSASHGLYWHNLRYYYNPITTLLEPIVFDNGPIFPAPDTQLSIFQYPDPYLRIAYVQMLEYYSQPEYLEGVIAAFGAQFQDYQRALSGEFDSESLLEPWDYLARRQAILRSEIAPPALLRGSYTWASDTAPAGLHAALLDQMLVPVELVGFQIDGETLALDPAWVEAAPGQLLAELPGVVLSSERTRLFDAVQVHIPAAALPDLPPAATAVQVAVLARLPGMEDVYTIPLSSTPPLTPLDSGPLPDPPTLEQALAQHPFLTLAGAENTLAVLPGEWRVEGDLIVPEGYVLDFPPGVTLRFQPGAILMSTSPVNIFGVEESWVHLTADAENWAGIVLLSAEAPSVWEYASVEHTAGVLRGNWVLTGATTFYESPITLDHVRFLHNTAEDGLNVIHSAFRFFATEFGEMTSDAFDGDFTTGTIEGCSFFNIQGDAIDVSGSTVSISNTFMRGIMDKAVSAGENSRLALENITISDVSIGISSKDLSRVVAEQVSITGARFAGLAAYIKKPEYGPAQIEAQNVTILDSPTPSLVQTG
ncbi:MAG: CotH kinase family protein, partial [Anaerolineae bacterium]|nr:CotH kinase family protein [Anaerolineae bacterium]